MLYTATQEKLCYVLSLNEKLQQIDPLKDYKVKISDKYGGRHFKVDSFDKPSPLKIWFGKTKDGRDTSNVPAPPKIENSKDQFEIYWSFVNE